MNEQQQKILEDRISDALLEPLTDEQLAQMDQILDNPAITEDQVEHFLRQIGVDVEGISQRVTREFMQEQGIQAAAPAQPVQPAQPQPNVPVQPQSFASVQPQMTQPQQPTQPLQTIQPNQTTQGQGV